jgi:Tfp pilus assembly protein PilN
MTGESKMSGSALLEYFQPLYEFLRAANNVGQNSEDSDNDQTILIVVGAVLLGIVIVVIVGYLIFRRRAAKRNANA